MMRRRERHSIAISLLIILSNGKVADGDKVSTLREQTTARTTRTAIRTTTKINACQSKKQTLAHGVTIGVSTVQN